ncbi:DUF4395 domain-containing protein [Planococcus sp. ISL-109]|uniref:DUF4395 domain-containing protein n=1 Tax=Planococcus sp. ISL-109 TaxID=2819166 RepID=UPI001BE7FC9C|nr:DUF4395 domain-containing protein [Planococcus sp. ISL-109]MBT2583312.1 DUF4395 domain-containing protein [Planococcus sp. ISL-109]
MTIPKPLVQLNQAFLVTTALAGLIIHPSILLVPFGIGVITLLTKKNPLIANSRRFLPKPPSAYAQEDRDQQLFNQWIATVCLGLALAFFALGMPSLATVFAAMVIIAAGVALMGYCIGCSVRYQLLMWKHRRTKTDF